MLAVVKGTGRRADNEHNRLTAQALLIATLHPRRVKKLPKLEDLLIKRDRKKRRLDPAEIQAMFRAHAMAHGVVRKAH